MAEINYIRNGDYLIPDLRLTPEEQTPIGKYGRMRREYLRKNNQVLFSSLSLSGKLWPHLSEIDAAAVSRMDGLMTQFAAQNGATEALKAQNPMAWTQLMNSLQAQAEEIVLQELVFS